MRTTFGARRRALLAGAAAPAIALAMWAGPGAAQDAVRAFEIAPQPLADALLQFSRQANIDIVAAADLTRGRSAPMVRGEMTADQAMDQLLVGSGLKAVSSGGGLVLARADQIPQGGSAAGGGATVEALIVTAQKREEDIQDVPIAISAFSQEDLTRSQVAGGPDLMTQIPNFTFTKTNFSSYSIQIRGIGTQAISATVDPAVAVAFNNTPFIRNRFFEQEFYDLQRVEVLRGPQGTLYGRNATAGVVNIISAKPSLHEFEAKASVGVANFGSHRLEGMVNIPLAEDLAALRIAGAWTKRDGYVTNQMTGEPIDGRDLWSTRVTLRIEPTDRLSANLIYEHFEEDDDRLRSGKQLCKRDMSPTHFGGAELPDDTGDAGVFIVSPYTSQGCDPASLYSPDSFQVPNGWALPYYGPLSNYALFPMAFDGDPYRSATQSRDLRVIESSLTPQYRAKADIVELQIALDVTESLQLVSETAYGLDEVFSFQDFNRFTTRPNAWETQPTLIETGRITPDGQFCDPQLGCSDRLLAGDLSTGKAVQFSQELRLSSDFDGPINFSLGGNFLKSDSVDKYYVFFNSLTLLSTIPDGSGSDWQDHYYVSGEYDGRWCLANLRPSDPNGAYGGLPFGCKYIDPNPINNLNDNGRNYFLSSNPYHLLSYAVFGEVQYELTPTLKFTGGLRWTVDKKEAPILPIWLLADDTYGQPVLKVIRQEWREPTGRAVLDWRPDLPFTDETLLYASYSHGYKAGGANPPLPADIFSDLRGSEGVYEVIAATHPPTFDPEFVDAFELGAKNTLFDRRLTLNTTAFFYDYTGYQISQIVDRSAINMNFDAEIWGAELEADWRALENLRFGLKLGYEGTRLAEGSSAVDMIDRTAGRTDWAVIKPFPTVPSNCIMPIWWLEFMVENESLGPVFYEGVCDAYYSNFDPITKLPYVPNPTVTAGRSIQPGYPGYDPSIAPNGGQGFSKELSGNELPNAPRYTATLTADYTVPLPADWLMTLHTDLYYQSEAWTRVFNTQGYDKLKAFTNVNLAAIFINEARGWNVMAYVKNVFDRDNITGAFLNSDDTGLTTNVFLTEPRLYGLRVTKEWTGGNRWNGAPAANSGPYPLTVEIGGQIQRHEAPDETMRPHFTDSFSAAISPFNLQEEALDWGDGRDVRLVYRPAAQPWTVSLGARFGKTNAGHDAFREEQGGVSCLVGEPYAHYCDDPKYIATPSNYGIISVTDREEHMVIDFAVGRDFGFGTSKRLARSQVSAGVRYARLESDTSVTMTGIPDWVLPSDWAAVKYSQHHLYSAGLDTGREFSGAGPAVSWDAAAALWEYDDGGGRLDVEWSISGGVLFGKQKTKVDYSATGGYFDMAYGYASNRNTPPTAVLPPVSVERADSNSKTVPVAGASLGLAYGAGRMRVGAGYRWERYFDALDAGLVEPKSYDRTIDGPYFKLAIGFGG